MDILTKIKEVPPIVKDRRVLKMIVCGEATVGVDQMLGMMVSSGD